MTQFDHPERHEFLPNYDVKPEDVHQDLETSFDNLIGANGELTSGTETVLSITSGVGMLTLEQSVETDTSTTEASWLSRVKASVIKKKNTIMTGALVTGAIGSWLFEIGPANENFRAKVAVEMLNQNKGALLAAGAVAAITFAIESITGILTAKTINKKDGVLGRFNNFLFKQTEEMDMGIEADDGHRKSDTLLGLAGGSTPVVIERLRRNPERTYEDSRRTAIAAAVGIAAFSGAITGVAADLIDWTIENNYFVQGNALKETLEDWRTWVGLFAAAQMSPQISKLSSKLSKHDKDTSEKSIVEPVEPTNLAIDNEFWEEIDRVERRRENIKMAAKVAAGVGFIAVGGPQEMAQLINEQNITHEAGGWLADNKTIDTAEDYASVMWDWRIYAGGFGALLAGNKIISKLQNKQTITT